MTQCGLHLFSDQIGLPKGFDLDGNQLGWRMQEVERPFEQVKLTWAPPIAECLIGLLRRQVPATCHKEFWVLENMFLHDVAKGTTCKQRRDLRSMNDRINPDIEH